MATAQLFDEFDRRHWRRHALDFDMTLTLAADGRRYRGTIEDISIGGLKLRLEGEMPAAEVLTVEHPRTGAFKARRVRQGEREIALAFEFADALPLLLYCAVSADGALADSAPMPKRVA